MGPIASFWLWRRSIMINVKPKVSQETVDTFRNLLDAEKKEEFRSGFLKLHKNDQFNIIRRLGTKARTEMTGILSPEEFAMIFKWFDRDEQLELFDEMDKAYGIRMLERMSTDNVRHFMEPLKASVQKELLDGLSAEKAAHIHELLTYKKGSAGSIMRKEFISGFPDDTASAMIEKLKSDTTTYEAVHNIYIADEDQKFIGLVSLRDLLMAEDENLLSSICDTGIRTVMPDMDQEHVARIMQDYDVVDIPVVSVDRELVGSITIDDIIDVIEFEMTEDVGELSASRGTTDVSVSPLTAAKKRAPWILILMFLGLITANVIGAFEETLEAVVLLSFFIPLVMDAAGNTGTQSLAVMVRTISTGAYEKNGIWHTMKRELGTGILMGIVSGVTIALLISVFYQDMRIGLIVGSALLLTLSVSTVVGSIVPVIISKLNIDPAVASGPFITTLNDVIGLLIYFTIATAMLQI